LKSKLFLAVLAAVCVFLISVTAKCQVVPERTPTQQTGPVYKNQAFLAWGYTSLNQVTGSRSGLQGIVGSYTRDFGSHIAATAQYGHYAWDVTSSNPGHPTVDLFLVGPEVRANLYEKLSGFAHGLIGSAHTGGVNIQPDYSFAGGIGLGLDYNRTARWGFRVTGDYIGSAFTEVPYRSGFSTHTSWNARAGVGVVYHF
jgi:hypothetical protein